jgi:hypothetical protein
MVQEKKGGRTAEMYMVCAREMTSEPLRSRCCCCCCCRRHLRNFDRLPRLAILVFVPDSSLCLYVFSGGGGGVEGEAGWGKERRENMMDGPTNHQDEGPHDISRPVARTGEKGPRPPCSTDPSTPPPALATGPPPWAPPGAAPPPPPPACPSTEGMCTSGPRR